MNKTIGFCHLSLTHTICVLPTETFGVVYSRDYYCIAVGTVNVLSRANQTKGLTWTLKKDVFHAFHS